jgi:hypothetical protein
MEKIKQIINIESGGRLPDEPYDFSGEKNKKPDNSAMSAALGMTALTGILLGGMIGGMSPRNIENSYNRDNSPDIDIRNTHIEFLNDWDFSNLIGDLFSNIRLTFSDILSGNTLKLDMLNENSLLPDAFSNNNDILAGNNSNNRILSENESRISDSFSDNIFPEVTLPFASFLSNNREVVSGNTLSDINFPLSDYFSNNEEFLNIKDLFKDNSFPQIRIFPENFFSNNTDMFKVTDSFKDNSLSDFMSNNKLLSENLSGNENDQRIEVDITNRDNNIQDLFRLDYNDLSNKVLSWWNSRPEGEHQESATQDSIDQRDIVEPPTTGTPTPQSIPSEPQPEPAPAAPTQ